MKTKAAVHLLFGISWLTAASLGVMWSSWPLLAAAVCVASAWAWRVTRL